MNQGTFDESRFVMTFLTILGVTEIFVGDTISNSRKVPTAKFLASNELSCFISICKFGRFKNLFITISSLPELYFWFRRFMLLVQQKKVIFMNYGNSTSSWKPWRWVIFTMTWYLQWPIYTAITTWTHPQNSPAAEETLSLKISSYGTSLKWSWRLSQSAPEES